MVEEKPPARQTENLETRHESRDANLNAIVGFGAGLGILIAVVLVVVGWMFHVLAAREAAVKRPVSPFAESERGHMPPEPLLEGLDTAAKKEQPPATKKEVRQEYAWENQKAGIVKIPIESAMTILADKLPARPLDAINKQEARTQEEPSASNSGRTRRKEQP
jgi:hypothetical protein